MSQNGLDALWDALRGDLTPEAERMLLRLIKAHVRLLAELARVAQAETATGD